VPAVPSPKLHVHATIEPSGSDEPAPLNASDVSVCVAWFGPASARGGWFGAVVEVVLVDVDVLVDEVVGRVVLLVDVDELVELEVDVEVVVGRVVLLVDVDELVELEVDVEVVVGRVVLLVDVDELVEVEVDVEVVVGRVVLVVVVVGARVVVVGATVVVVGASVEVELDVVVLDDVEVDVEVDDVVVVGGSVGCVPFVGVVALATVE